MKRTAWAGFLIMAALPLLGQATRPVPATALTSSSATLQLPGSVKLTATVAPPATSSGMPGGSVTFLNGTTSLGTGALTVLPATQNFSAPALNGTFGYDPFGIFTLGAGTSKYSVLGVLDWYFTSEETFEPQLTIYSGQGANLFQASSATAYQITNSNIIGTYPGIDAYAVADFNKDGTQDVLLHGYTGDGNEYYMLPGTSGGGFDQTLSVISPDNSGIQCDCSNPTEVMTVDDFNGDGYPDVAYAANQFFYNGNIIGVALNAGATAPGSFPTYKTAPAASNGTAGDLFLPTSISSGHFTASGHADLVVAGYFTTAEGLSVTPGNVALFLGNGDGTFVAPAIFPAGDVPAAVATADFRNNGMTDVVVASDAAGSYGGGIATKDRRRTSGLPPVHSEATHLDTLQVLFGDGKGNLTTSTTLTLSLVPASLNVADVNGDGYPDILVTMTDGSVCLALNDGTGHFTACNPVGAALDALSLTTTGDFNGDGLPDVAEITQYPTSDSTTFSTASALLNSASSQAILDTAPQTLPAGSDMVTASFPGDNNFAASTSADVPITVTQTAPTLTWAQPAAMEYGTPLSTTQLNATASVAGSITYQPAAGAILPPGPTTVMATFAPTDSFDYSGATASQTITVTAPSFTGIAPSSAKLGDGNTTITVAGQGLVAGATVYWNNTALATTWVNLNTLTAVVPSSLLTTAGTGTITVVDPNKVAVTGSATFTILATSATATASASATAEAGQNASVTLTVSPYPAAITATLTLSFTPAPPNTVPDPAVLFPNNTTTDVIQIPANSTAAIPAIDFSSGSTAGTITVTVVLTAGGANITPATLVPVTITVPASPPVINSVTLTRSGTSMTVAILGLSSTRDMTQAHFHFTPASGESLKTTDLTVDLTTPFGTWYGSATSDTYGTTFLYTQPFTLDPDANAVGSVTVTLTNSQGSSQPGTAQ